ncbi:hypothetical protein GV828_02595 [Flavobacterium sp. NST-5]|uniref:Lipocalin-like domain-containing protein n=1 Tax=Flavobacterium ichthyis TaxID=2698827 RepID=A0ABW9Z5G3_9FLAO|nr:hypothetical protein [Flavobacterium ichthyis]NBL64086.1 hypothetical protein [Flavobacterium ichthyis]
MKLKKLPVVLSFFTALILTSCSHRMVGTWTVQRFETITPGQPGVTLSNIGTMEFKKNGSGEKNLDYSVLGIQRDDKLPFDWTWNDGKYITIQGEGSDLSKTWIIITNERKYQKWKATNGANNVQTIELKK